MKIKLILSFIVLFVVITVSKAQDIENWIDKNEKVPVEKIYLHLDSEHYFQSDTIWFKVYLMDSRSGKLIPGAENIYINLVDKTGKSVVHSILLSNDGVAFGNFAIPNSLKPDNYNIQAYTNYLLNFTDDTWFQKPISISRKSTSSLSANNKSGSKELVADLTFFPEGGVLLEGNTNLVAFKAINNAGFGVNANGTVKDEKGKTIATFKTDYKGMGLFFITPEQGKQYHATVKGFPSFSYTFKPVKEKLKIQIVNHTSNEVIVNIAGNSEAFINKTFYLANMHRGEVLFYQPFEMEGINQVLKYDSQNLKAGINKFILLSEDLKPLSECLLFSKNFEINQLKIVSDKERYNPLSRVQLTIEDNKNLNSDEVSKISISVLNKLAFGENGKTQNILSYLLIDSDLNNFFEPSAEFFMNNGISSDAKLKLLMLTNGWSSYLWNSIPEKTNKLQLNQTAGIDLTGIAKNSLTEKPLVNGEITLVIQKDKELAFLTKETNEEGEFTFPGLMFSDTATIHVQAKNDKRNQRADITVLSPFIEAKSSNKNLAALNQNQIFNAELQKIKYRDYSNNRTFKRRKNNKFEEKKSDDGHYRLYESADFILDLNENVHSFDNVIDYLVGKVPGVDVNGEEVRIRGTNSFSASSSPMFLIDGVPLVSNSNFNIPEELLQGSTPEDKIKESDERLIQTVKSIPINDVDKIEILKSPQNLAVFGTNGANGVIAIYTRSGEESESNKTAKGVIEKQIVGYSSYKTFYSPKYLPESKNNKSNDFRTTLYWNPNISTKNGTAEVSFSTSNEVGPHIVIVEGITNNGKICLGEAEIEVYK